MVKGYGRGRETASDVLSPTSGQEADRDKGFSI